MSRDIKFRGKSIRHGEWKIGDLIIMPLDCIAEVSVNGDGWELDIL